MWGRQLWRQTVRTSLTQRLSQAVVQQKGSPAQMVAAHGSHADVSLMPVLQIE